MMHQTHATPVRMTWAVQLSQAFPHLQIDCYARSGHGLDYQDLCLKHIITQQNYDAVIIQLTTEHRGTVPLRTLDDEARFESVDWQGNNFTQYNLMSPKIVYSIGFMREENQQKERIGWNTSSNKWNSSKSPIRDLWQNNIIGNTYNSFQSRKYCDMLPYYSQLQPNLMWFQWDAFSWQDDDHRGQIQNIHDQYCSAHDWAEKELNYTTSDRYTLENDDHLNDEGNARLLNEYILPSKIGTVLRELN
tara:strand:+ start:126 stop:866 length:741 start_codon:yes stop_codon:yes gene_type:complete